MSIANILQIYSRVITDGVMQRVPPSSSVKKIKDSHNESNLEIKTTQSKHDRKMTDFSVVLFRPNFMLASEEYLVKTHKNQPL
jgi:hypothetical protein